MPFSQLKLQPRPTHHLKEKYNEKEFGYRQISPNVSICDTTTTKKYNVANVPMFSFPDAIRISIPSDGIAINNIKMVSMIFIQSIYYVPIKHLLNNILRYLRNTIRVDIMPNQRTGHRRYYRIVKLFVKSHRKS